MPATKASDALLSAMDSTIFKEKMDDMLKTMISVALLEFEKSVEKKINDAVEKGTKAVNDELIAENEILKNTISKFETQIVELLNKVDELEQYSRKNCLIVSGVPKSERPTKEIVTDLAGTMGIRENITAHDIDNCHWIGEKIIVKFTNYTARHAFYTKRKEAGEGVFVNENLTKKRSELLFKCRTLKKEKKLLAAWTNDGQIKIKLPNGTNRAIKSLQDVLNLID